MNPLSSILPVEIPFFSFSSHLIVEFTLTACDLDWPRRYGKAKRKLDLFVTEGVEGRTAVLQLPNVGRWSRLDFQVGKAWTLIENSYVLLIPFCQYAVFQYSQCLRNAIMNYVETLLLCLTSGRRAYYRWSEIQKQTRTYLNYRSKRKDKQEQIIYAWIIHRKGIHERLKASRAPSRTAT